ncbi:antibiotic biosynthesis monooxygenase family protein [Weissella soli]|uniref:Quinol monooxygenase YgiN n=1 Tax=Weissella soli TaxID=155866 RepID=A0A288Q665_9LACO|nr:putative quinol monooxygenase [Weissella soli]AOT56359.1 4-carboxymuconolactone decarboxylase [Weissella soli]MCT8394975.1 antibiotic biosynthesis monooxygenase [Weissella soli]NKY82813.1 antibiotic biosynthesis monooxygenase [Weissella soli]RDL11929.1 quinol monooxygenase YgiN [Weissella soli]GEN92841.1 antibiotic biosynthesis monooxygenase [Weissella soli]
MAITVNILYTGESGNAKKFAEEMVASGIVARVRQEVGNERYEYFFPMEDVDSVLLIDQWTNQEAIDFHHKSPMMQEIAQLRDKYQLHMQVTRFQELD